MCEVDAGSAAAAERAWRSSSYWKCQCEGFQRVGVPSSRQVFTNQILCQSLNTASDLGLGTCLRGSSSNTRSCALFACPFQCT